MLLILEGPDLGGKSTIAKMIAAEVGVTPKHFGGKPSSYDEIEERIKKYWDAGMIDRHTYISELVYSRCTGRESLVSVEQFVSYFSEFGEDIIIFFCCPPIEYLLGQLHFLKKTDKPYKTLDHIEEVIQNYRCIYQEYLSIMNFLEKLTTVHKLDFRKVTRADIRILTNEYTRR